MKFEIVPGGDSEPGKRKHDAQSRSSYHSQRRCQSASIFPQVEHEITRIPRASLYLKVMRLCFWLVTALALAAPRASAQAAAFAPLERWKAAVVRGNAGALKSLYSTEPPAKTVEESRELSIDDEVAFWTGLKAKTVTLKLAQSTSQPGVQRVIFQAEIRSAPPGRTLYIMAGQLWQQQGSAWKLVGSKRTQPTKLEQPFSVKENIYPAADAREEIRQALVRAAKSNKRVLVVFGADWCYDCHVLDKAFQRGDIAAVLNSNYEVVHVDVGEGDKNQDLMNEYQVPMKRGIPALAVLNSRGTLIYSQKNGEFERARALGPEDLLEFLRKWKS
jgi:hypothetical protein